jgi:hypothetical protein
MPSVQKIDARLAAVRRRLKTNQAALRNEERKLGAALVQLLKTDAEFRAMLLPKLQAAVTNPRDKAAIESFLA